MLGGVTYTNIYTYKRKKKKHNYFYYIDDKKLFK